MQDSKILQPQSESVSNANSKTAQNKVITLEDNRPSTILQKKANNTGLPDNLKSGIENLSGHAMDDVKVHYNSDKPAQLNAHAYAQGTNIHIASGQEKHLPHEAWHVVQQKQGRVKPTMQMKGKVNVNDDSGLEKEADVMGAKALQLENNSLKSILQKKQNNEGAVSSNLFTSSSLNLVTGSNVFQMQRNYTNRYLTSNKINHRINQERNKQAQKWSQNQPKREIKKKKKAANKKARERKNKENKEKFLGLGKNKAWMEIIDGEFHHLGSKTFDEGKHDEEPEPGYLSSMMKAREFVSNTMGRKMDDKYLEEIHKHSASHKKIDEDYHSGYRNENDNQVSVAYSAKEDVDSEEGDYVKGAPKKALEELDPNVTRAFHTEGLEDEDINDDTVNEAPETMGNHQDLNLWFKTKRAQEVRAEVNKIMHFYYDGIKSVQTRKEKLLLISTTHRKLENLHPFIDANTRTNRLVLHRMLVENGMSPVILDHPLQVHLKSNEEWSDVLEDGMKKWSDAKNKR